jgi:hypothetical protein
MKTTRLIPFVLAASFFCVASQSCRQREETPAEELEDKVDDALDQRPAEGARDAVEDAVD